MMKSAVVIFSGGMDSTTLLYSLLADGVHCRALSIDYGQRHRIELSYARKTALALGVEFEIADMRQVGRTLLGGSSLTSETPVPHGHYAADSMKATVVPNRNMILLSLAIGWAVATKSEAVAYGAHAGDHTIYPDCRPEFAAAMARAARLADWHPVELIRPFITMTKAEIVTLGSTIGVPYQETWSCYEGDALHCGLCGTCVERIEAFKDAGVPDPTIYRQAA